MDTDVMLAKKNCTMQDELKMCISAFPQDRTSNHANKVRTKDTETYALLLKAVVAYKEKIISSAGLTVLPFYEPVRKGEAAEWITSLTNNSVGSFLSNRDKIERDFTVSELQVLCLIMATYNKDIIKVLEEKDKLVDRETMEKLKAISQMFDIISGPIFNCPIHQNIILLTNMINEVSARLSSKEKLLSDFNPSISDIDIIASLLGLREEVVNDMKTLDKESWYHQPEIYFVFKAIENMQVENCEYLLYQVDENVFYHCGFLQERSRKMVDAVTEEFFFCQNASYWAQKYVSDSLLNHPIFAERKDYPYMETNEGAYAGEDRFFRININRHGSNSISVQIMNATSCHSQELLKVIKDYLKNQQSDHHCFWFHGTNHTSASSLLESGINLCMGKLTQDFSDGKGFYLTDKLTFSLKWSRLNSKPAVVIYKIPKLLLDTDLNKGLDLYMKPRELKEIVRYYKSGRKESLKLPINPDEFKYIIGERCTYPIGSDGPKPCGDDLRTQLCIKNADYAKAFGSVENILAVIFYKSK